MAKPRSTEVDAYDFIRQSLRSLGWIVKNPARDLQGQVYTQNECLSHPEIKKQLGAKRPENIVKLTETLFYVIEAKAKRENIGDAISDAEGRLTEINRSNVIKVVMISGVAGNDSEGYVVKSKFLADGMLEHITINGQDVSSIISPEIAKTLLSTNQSNIEDLPIDEKFFISKAEEINKVLHLGAINKTLRARVIAALLLSLVEDTPPNLDAPPSILIAEINARVKRVLANEGKPEFYRCIEISAPTSEANHNKFKIALVRTLQELQNLNIRSAMSSGTDVLGKFYEVFLKYGNGAKEIGIVLTPRHLTKFVANVSNVTPRDIVLDPACGTGGFLVSAFDKIQKETSEEQINAFKRNGLFGIEQESEVVALAIVNMIFRGDGKNNIIEGDCFHQWLVPDVKNGVATAEYVTKKPEKYKPPVTKVMMNPPFALKASDEKEYKFVNRALSQMAVGGLLFSVLPYSTMVKPNQYLRWRRDLLKDNSLLSVITFPEDLFYPIGVITAGVFVKKGVPHPPEQDVLWIRAVNDGFAKSKGKRLLNEKVPNDFETVRTILKSFLIDPQTKIENVQKFERACPIDFSDKMLELVAENYLDEAAPDIAEMREGVDKVVRDTVAYLITSRKEDVVDENLKSADN